MEYREPRDRVGVPIQIPLFSTSGLPFFIPATGKLSRLFHDLDRGMGTPLGWPDLRIDGENPAALRASARQDEAIASSQLAGAVTETAAAKAMLRGGRKPADHSEGMITGNFRALKLADTRRDEVLSVELMLDLHRVLLEATPGKADAAGRFRREDEEVADGERDLGGEFGSAPKAGEAAARLKQLGVLANDGSADGFVHPVLRAMVVHFWVRHDRPFVDGNGQMARLLFGWTLRRHGYHLFDYLSPSAVIRQAPAEYENAGREPATRGGDLGAFFSSQGKVIDAAVGQLQDRLQRHRQARQAAGRRLDRLASLNPRQQAILLHALRRSGAEYTIEGHRGSHAVVYQTARTDLLALVERGLLRLTKRGKEMVFHPAPDLEEQLGQAERREPARAIQQFDPTTD